MTQGNIELDTRDLLALILKMLNKVFFAVSRDDAKRLYQIIAGGERAPFMSFETRSGATFTCRLALDSSEYDGKLNFSAFRGALAAHLHQVSKALKEETSLNLFSNDEGNETIFHHPGIIQAEGRTNILVSGFEQQDAGTLCIKLLFLNPEKLAEAASSGRPAE
ncbi:MAG: hypothetical protein P8126_05840 [Gammaproteobacteria bacterium]|jgi:hypothetical protein